MSRTRIVKGNITKIIGGNYKRYSNDEIENIGSKVIQVGKEDGVIYGNPEKYTPAAPEESEYKLESSYIHDHIKMVASEITSQFDADNTSIVYKFYKDIAEGKIANPPIVVTKNRPSLKAFYDEESKNILVWEAMLPDIEKDNDKKIKLIAALAEAYGQYINAVLKESLPQKDNFDTYDYDLFRFDASGESTVVIAKLESPTYKGNLDISFPKPEGETEAPPPPPDNYYFREREKERGGPSAGNFDGYYEAPDPSANSSEEGPGDPPFNIGMKFSFSLGGGFSASLYAGISKQIKMGNFGVMPSFNAALTYYGYGTPGTSPMSRHLVTLSGTPAITLGYKTGNSLNMNLFNQFSGSGVNNPYEYAFTLGSTGVLSSGRVTSEYDKNGKRLQDKYNKFDTPHRHQIIGGSSIKVGNFMISSYNDIFKPPLFFGMDSDQYWSAGVNVQAKITDKINMAYAFDLYYGKSNNENPYNLDKNIDGQNYDTQRLFDLLLNRGQETFSFTDAQGNLNTRTKFGYGTFWPSNNMHNAIDFPSEPKKPKEPIESDYKDRSKFDEAIIQYKKDMDKYYERLTDYKISVRLKPNSTFHHLFVVYSDGSRKPNFNRLKKYFEADIPNKELQKFYRLESENENKKNETENK
ncbi:polymorphic toxin type 23 domain-containing protein [Chryseobacterium sp. 2987]|uniref:polymorphic toxin type 23 domain-containing protein n=1 Tax=Chryseobacterium sp. 2987 TaxID=2817767 RepID=UPI002860AD55|nr:polymorphic toxin type 23 domain-containing protein [Chryseobacterium sp. 2987]MDR6920507.1 hypothetical protein [Chryseobacterium sp. 2987]